MLSLCRIIISFSLVCLSGQVVADISNSPNPYDPGYGFDTPNEAGWGGWTRGDINTLYAEWDIISDASYGESNDQTTAPDVGTYNVADAYLGWNPGLISTSTGNLISPVITQEFNISISPASLFISPLIVALQVETWGGEPAVPLVNGLAASSWTRTFTSTSASVTGHDLNQYLGLWHFTYTINEFKFDLISPPFVSLAQVAVDIAQVPEPHMLAIMLTGLILIGSMTRYRSSPA